MNQTKPCTIKDVILLRNKIIEQVANDLTLLSETINLLEKSQRDADYLFWDTLHKYGIEPETWGNMCAALSDINAAIRVNKQHYDNLPDTPITQ